MFLEGALAVVLGAAGGELPHPCLLQVQRQKVQGGGREGGRAGGRGQGLEHPGLHLADLLATVGVVGPVRAVVVLGRGGLDPFGRDHEGRDTHQLQLLPRDVVRAAQELRQAGSGGGWEGVSVGS